MRSLGRVIVLLYTASCWCKARLLQGELAVAAAEEREEAKRVEQEGDIELGLSLDQSCQFTHLPAGEVLAKGSYSN